MLCRRSIPMALLAAIVGQACHELSRQRGVVQSCPSGSHDRHQAVRIKVQLQLVASLRLDRQAALDQLVSPGTGMRGVGRLESGALQTGNDVFGLELLAGKDMERSCIKPGCSLKDLAFEAAIDHVRIVAIVIKGCSGNDDETDYE